MEVAAQWALIALVVALRFHQIDARASPDCQYYLNMSVGRQVPSPYCYRALVPWLTRALGVILPFKPLNIMRVIVTAGILALLPACWFLAISLGCSEWAATAAVMILVNTDSLFGVWAMFPWLTDPWAFAFAAAAGIAPEASVLTAVLLALAAMTKESAWILGAVFCLFMGAAWWVPLPGLILLVAVRLLIRAAPPDTDWLKEPFVYATTTKRRNWFLWEKHISGMKATPFVAAWVLAGSATALPALAIAVLSWAQGLVAVDQNRLSGVASVWLVPLAAAICPAPLLSCWVLIQHFWPFESEFV